MADVNMQVVRSYSIQNGLTPTGRKLGVAKVANTSLFRVGFVDDRPGKLPSPLDGMYTTSTKAKEAMDSFLNKLWDESDEASMKAAKKAQANAMATETMIEALERTSAAATSQ